MKKVYLQIIMCCVVLMALPGFAVEKGLEQQDKTAWFEGKWGVFFHYLANPAGQIDGGKSAEEWSKQIDEFDVKGLAKQLKEVGADYFVITIGQGSGHYLANNKVYDELTGIKPSKCSKRDLVADLADELNPLGIKLMVYTGSEIGWGDLAARKALGMTSHHNDHKVGLRNFNIPNDWKKNREGQIEWLKNSEKIHAQWSKQWGEKIAGWWVDGCYHADVRFPANEPPNLKTLKDVLLTGNSAAIVTFNRGIGPLGYSKEDDYIAGEIAEGLPPCPGPWVEKDGHKIRYHLLTYLGTYWGQGNPRYSDDAVAKFVSGITSKGGFVSLDTPPQINGLIPDSFMKQLKAIGSYHVCTAGEYYVQLGREQYGAGRFAFNGAIDDVYVYSRALNGEQIEDLMSGTVPEGAVYSWTMDTVPAENTTVSMVEGKRGKALKFAGNPTSYIDCGILEISTSNVTVACWIKIDKKETANYILSSGEWNEGVSLGLSRGKLRFAVNGKYVEASGVPDGEWIHVAGIFDGSTLELYCNGKK